ncbi:unnamed protein product [Brachionus calyciflorus]|uniref:Uncharacterized protein n=1 Tax=Brachionus calyciflorus TaxID=104777 RepID=A0A813XP10_9BILA|nr:unnamed protein product [Brachionus calyciflorus]
MALDEYKLDTNEIKIKFMAKLNQSLNDCIEKLNDIISSIESHLNSMTRQCELGLCKNEHKLEDSMEKINKKFWLCLYELKSELTYENLVKTYSTKKLNDLVDKWLKLEFLHLQTEIEICRCYSSK